MERFLWCVALAILFCGGALGQSDPDSPVFEVADFHLRDPDPFMSARAEGYMSGGMLPIGRYEMHRANLSDLIQRAYGLQSYEISGGPIWLETQLYELVAKAPPTTSPDNLKLMLRALLTDRLKLVVSDGMEPMDVNAVLVAKEGSLKEGTGETGCRTDNPIAAGETPPPVFNLNCTNVNMANFTMMFRGVLGGLPLVDLTGLEGSYDFTLNKLVAAGTPDARIQSFLAALEAIGLKIEARNHPMPVLVVDSVERTPTPNVPDVEKLLGVPTEFEAASVKPTGPDNPTPSFQVSRGRVTVENVTLRTLLAISHNLFPILGVRNYTRSDVHHTFERELISGGPKWIEQDGFDIVATADVAAPYSPAWIPDHVAVMLRALLAERFNLVTHTEVRPVRVWQLERTRGEHKLTPADPTSRTGCKYSGSQMGAGSDAMPAEVYTCTNVTMAQLAESLHNMNRAYVDLAAVDRTGLEGGYDFVLKFVRAEIMAARRAQGQRSSDGGVTPSSSVFSGITLFEALDSLGLKLERGRAPQKVLVIDSVDRLKPN